ncbi:MAG: bifunctional precorrin-2 dehydrogenase/sirohydrochlorin ferrochelatase [Candidatus Rokubacteria bacterium]|nr:bifunctional precorrin-2 dehydrogenase/sirohydrochlorin ferrochelatase [Candidatus Rokubacteria bacterium]
MSRYYPVVLDLGGRPCVVIGGGTVAERKIAALLAAGALVTVVAPTVTAAVAASARAGALVHVARAYRPGDLAGQRLALVATGAPGVSAAVAAEGDARRIWVNAADDAAHSTFILPSVLRRGDLTLAVGTGGASPALARLVREELERHLGPEYATLVDVAGDVRRELARRGKPSTGEAWTRGVDDGVRRLVREGRRDEARARLLARLESG